LDLDIQDATAIPANWPLWTSFVIFYTALDVALAAGMIWLFGVRWRVAH
jgi:hypothetical protein